MYNIIPISFFIFIGSSGRGRGGGQSAPRGIKKMINKISLTAENKKLPIVYVYKTNAQVIKR